MLHPAIVSAALLLSRVVLAGGALAMLVAFWRRR
jgi:hypothetical protein